MLKSDVLINFIYILFFPTISLGLMYPGINHSSSHWRERQRAQTILWLSQAKTVLEIADLHSVIPETIRLHRRKWKANKIDAIWEGKRSGHPPKRLEQYKEKILSWVNHEPLNTAQIKQKLYEEFQLEVSQEPIRVFLKSGGIVYKRARQ